MDDAREITSLRAEIMARKLLPSAEEDTIQALTRGIVARLKAGEQMTGDLREVMRAADLVERVARMRESEAQQRRVRAYMRNRWRKQVLPQYSSEGYV